MRLTSDYVTPGLGRGKSRGTLCSRLLELTLFGCAYLPHVITCTFLEHFVDVLQIVLLE